MKKSKTMKMRSLTVKIEAAELTKAIGKEKHGDVRKFIIMNVNDTLISGASVKTAKIKL